MQVPRQTSESANINALLEASEARIRTLFASLPVGLVILNEEEKIESVSPALCRLLGYETLELSKKSVDSLFKVKPAFDPKHPETSAIAEAISKDHELIPVEVTQVSFYIANSEKKLLMLVDISERVRAEQMKSELTAMLTHDLRSPISAVSFFLDLLKTGNYGAINETGTARLTEVQANLNRILGLINEMLEVDRLEAGAKLIITKEPVEKIIEEASSMVSEIAIHQGVTIEAAKTDLIVEGDHELLIRVVMNLLSNAIKFSPQGKSVKVEADHVDNFIEIRVMDEGKGISERDQETLFQRYKQAGKRSEARKTGFGLGLATCKAIVLLHGGAIGVKSAEGKGSEFWFRIPLKPST
jgi:PAS domain S-box-containing protein